jgi:bacteriocin biosynthesis cyclodehydratase domain-containing protein
MLPFGSLRVTPGLERTGVLEDLTSEPSTPTVIKLAALLDGTRTVESACGDLLGAGCDPAQVTSAIRTLIERRVLQESSDGQRMLISDVSRYANQLAFFASAKSPSGLPAWSEAHSAQKAIEQAKIVVICDNRIGREVLLKLAGVGIGHLLIADHDSSAIDDIDQEGTLERLPSRFVGELTAVNPDIQVTLISYNQSVEIPPIANEADLWVYCPDSFSIQEASYLNISCLQAGVPLLVHRSRLLTFEFGPLIIPGETACYECLLARQRAAIGVIEPDQHEPEHTPARLNIALGPEWIALEIVRWLAGFEAATKSRVWRFDILSGLCHISPILKLPRCSICGVHRQRPVRRLWEE